MRAVPLERLEDTYWYSFNDEPIATVSAYPYPRLGSPAFLLPDEAPDSLWHLFAETVTGIDHFTSTSGLEWKREDSVVLFGRSPSIYREGSVYYLLYETERKGRHIRSCPSSVMLSSSTDLSSWSDPVLLLEASDVQYASYRGDRERLYRPQLVQWQGRYRLYFGTGRSALYGSMPPSAAYLSYADGHDIEGPYEPLSRPVIEPDPASMYRSLAVGSVRIVPCSDGLGAVDCSLFYDPGHNAVRSAMVLMRSLDGTTWEDVSVMQISPLDGWASRVISACDIRYKENEGTWYCYYAASGPVTELPFTFHREALGLLLGKERR